MTFLYVALIVVSCLALGAHFLRAGAMPLVAVSLFLLILPRSWSDRFKSLTQVLSPGQSLLYSVSTAGGQHVRALAGNEVSEPDHAATVSENQALRRQVAALTSHVRELQARRAELLRLRDRGLLTRARLIPASVVARGSSTWRDTMLMDQGERRGVRPGQWVATRAVIRAGTSQGVREGMAVLAREALVGQVERVAPYTARVRLLSDPDTRLRVRLGHYEADSLRVFETVFLLTGAGRGVMEIRNVRYDDVETERIRVGDVVLAEPEPGRTPIPLVLGKVSRYTLKRDDLITEQVVLEP